MSGTPSGGIGEQAAARPLGLAFRKAQGIVSAPIGLREATARTKTAPQTRDTTASTPLLGGDESERDEDTSRRARLGAKLGAKPKPKPKPKPNPKAMSDELSVEEQIRLMDEAARTQAGAGTGGDTGDGGKSGGGSGGSGASAEKSEEDLAYEAFMAEHPEWYVILPDDASWFAKACALPRSCWLFCVRLGENFGYGYVMAVFFTYGLNQGISGAWVSVMTTASLRIVCDCAFHLTVRLWLSRTVHLRDELLLRGHAAGHAGALQRVHGLGARAVGHQGGLRHGVGHVANRRLPAVTVHHLCRRCGHRGVLVPRLRRAGRDDGSVHVPAHQLRARVARRDD
jgi:hypothetical protein